MRAIWDEIKAAEEKAASVLMAAREEAQSILARAEVEARSRRARSEEEAKRRAEELVARRRQAAEQAASCKSGKTRAEIERGIKDASARLPEAAAEIVEKVMG